MCLLKCSAANVIMLVCLAAQQYAAEACDMLLCCRLFGWPWSVFFVPCTRASLYDPLYIPLCMLLTGDVLQWCDSTQRCSPARV